ncbi:MAG TPA: glycerate kinase [Candidatus Polarisedimenticolia bacterium]|jgi:glycerate kinase
MRVLLAPDKFRGTFTASQVCAHLARGMKRTSPDIVVLEHPLADGGEGTLEALLAACGGTSHILEVHGPLGEPVEALYGVAPDGTALLESARFCGLGLVPPGSRDPMRASSRGLGEAVAACLDAGLRRFLIGLGGSATVDGGTGMARALGFRFLERGGEEIRGVGSDLPAIVRIDGSMAHPGLAEASFTVLHDVDNPVLGPSGAAIVYGPQKGASPADLLVLEAGLEHVVSACAHWGGQDPSTLAMLPGGGAAGGLGLACRTFLGALLRPGAPFLLERLSFADRLAEADLVVTGEGSFDAQSLQGKVAARVIEAAAGLGLPAALVAGRWDGSLPARRPAIMRVFTGSDLAEGGGQLDAQALSELGGRIVAWARSGPG